MVGGPHGFLGLVYNEEVSLVVYFEKAEGILKWGVTICHPHHSFICIVDGLVPYGQVPGGIGVGKETELEDCIWGEEGLVGLERLGSC